ncbi:MAG TPA: hypothetical protein VGL65_13485 [Gemmatimonadales bacterium]|jgi:hypothetical protein
MVRSFIGAIAVVAILGTGALAAQGPRVPIVPGERVALRIPPAAFADSLVDSLRRIPIAVAERSGDAMRVNGRDEWESAGFVSPHPVGIDSVRVDPRNKRLDITVEGNDIGQVLVRVPLGDTAFVFARIFSPAGDTATIESAGREAVAARVFAGAMSVEPAAQQAALLQLLRANILLSAVRVDSAEGRPYLAFRASESTYTCAGRPITDPERLGDVLEEVALPVLWNVGHAAPAQPGSFGYVVTVRMKREYSCGSEPAPGDSLTIYVGADAAGEFAAASVTGRKLISESPIFFRGHRIAVAFSK